MDIRLDVSVDTIVKDFNLKVVGNSGIIVNSIGSLQKSSANSIAWAKSTKFLRLFQEGAVICSEADFEGITKQKNVTYLITTSSPRLTFSKVLIRYLEDQSDKDFINEVQKYKQRDDIKIGNNVFIGPNVSIGSGTKIHHNVVIHSNSIIGKNCIVMSNSSIGTEGLGFEFDSENNEYIKFPQIGGVILEDKVEIGPNSTVRRSALDYTIIKTGTKIGALCNIGHNSIVGEHCIFTCNVVTSGSSVVGNHVFIGVSSVVKQGKNVGNNVTIGQGAVVVKDIPDGETWVGNPAKRIIAK